MSTVLRSGKGRGVDISNLSTVHRATEDTGRPNHKPLYGQVEPDDTPLRLDGRSDHLEIFATSLPVLAVLAPVPHAP